MTCRRRPNTLLLAIGTALVFVAGTAATGRTQDPPQSDPIEETLRRQNAKNDSLLNPETLDRDTTELWNPFSLDNPDSLLEYMNRDRDQGLHFSFTPLSFSTYNRVEGQRVGVAFRLADQRRFEAETAGGYAFKAHRWSGFGRITLGEPNGPAVGIEGHDRVLTFGPNRIEYAAGFLALVAGQDRQDYLRSRGGSLTVWPRRSPGGQVWITAAHAEELSLEALTGHSIFGGHTPMEYPNPEIDEGRTRSISIGGRASFRQAFVDLNAEAGVAGGELGGDFDYSWQRGQVTLRPVFPDGGVFSLALEGVRTGGSPPVQAVPYLGGDGNLRAYERLEFAGKSRASLRAEYATGVDLLGRTGLRFLRKLRLQFIPFVDAGTTWDDVRAVETSRGNLDGEIKSSVGLGVRREIWLPGIQAVRLDVSRRTDGADDPWSVWFRLLPLQ